MIAQLNLRNLTRDEKRPRSKRDRKFGLNFRDRYFFFIAADYDLVAAFKLVA